MGLTIKGEKREVFGKNASRRIRREGKVPAILYGPNTTNVPLILKKKDVFTVLKSEAGENTIFIVSYDSEKRDAMIKDLQKDPMSDEVLHLDLIEIAMDKVIRVAVPLDLVGEPIGVKSEGGFVDFITRELEIECLPKDIPEQIVIEISKLHLHQSIKVEEVIPPEGTKVTSDSHAIIVLIQAPVKEEFEVVEEEEEEVVGEEAEPEVIKKEKPEEKEEKEK